MPVWDVPKRVGGQTKFRYRAVVRRKNRDTGEVFSRSKIFDFKRDADAWCKEMEALAALIFSGVDLRSLSEVAKSAVMGRNKKAIDKRNSQLRSLVANFGDVPVTEITKKDVDKYVAMCQQKELSNATIRKHIYLLSKLIKKVDSAKAVTLIATIRNDSDYRAILSTSEHRERRVSDDEISAIIKANRRLRAHVLIAVNSGMRLSEILAMKLTWLKNETIQIPAGKTKTEKSRTIIVTSVFFAELLDMLQVGLPSYTQSGLSNAFTRAAGKAGIVDITFHDLRHEAISRWFEPPFSLTIPEVMSQSGHTSMAMLKRYAHPHIANIRTKIK